MIEFSGKIPIRIHPAFWIFAAIIGYINSFSLVGTLIWMAVILVSVLFHELGHALTALIFKRRPRIDLVALGGLTYHEGKEVGKLKQFLIVLNGPLFGFGLLVISAFILKGFTFSENLTYFLKSLVLVNFFWTIINLLPVIPLDGGQLVRIVLEAIFGVKGVRYALFVSMLVGGAIAFACFLYQAYLLGAIVFLFAFQSFDSFRKSKDMNETDQKEELKQALLEAEVLISTGKNEEAIKALESFREKTKGGLLYKAATQDLSYLFYKIGKLKEVYFLLKPMQNSLSDAACVFLHHAASFMNDAKTVLDLSGTAYQLEPTFDNAIRNATAAASLGNLQVTMGWLATAKEFDVDLKSVLSNQVFDNVKEEKEFILFVESLK